MRNYLIAIGTAALIATGAQAATKPMAGSELMPMAKVSLATARATALHARPLAGSRTRSWRRKVAARACAIPST
ncbi:hypothetical protein [Sphingomonas oryzagri]